MNNFPCSSTKAGIHGRHQLKARREIGLPRRPGDRDVTRFEGFAQYFQHSSVKLGKLIQK
jgi:hypothetical protein